jgi:GntR family transcriptional repressor for pyruvate dehydrogenase complex
MATGSSKDRLYRDLAQVLRTELAEGRYPVGSRLPAERDLALRFDVSRPTVREAIIALEVQGLVEVKLGSGAYVRQIPGEEDRPGFNVTAFELTEARLLFEGEAAALAATQVTDADIAEIEQLVQRIAEENREPDGYDNADREFHLAIARATRNVAVFNAVEQLWNLRSTSPEAVLLHEKARGAKVKPVVEEHMAVLDALRARDPNAARTAMRAHLSAVLEALLFATEERAVENTRRAIQAQRDRYSRATA